MVEFLSGIEAMPESVWLCLVATLAAATGALERMGGGE